MVILAVACNCSLISANPKWVAFAKVSICRVKLSMAGLFLKADNWGVKIESELHLTIVCILGCFQVSLFLTSPHSWVVNGDSFHKGHNINTPNVHCTLDSPNGKYVVQIPLLCTYAVGPNEFMMSSRQSRSLQVSLFVRWDQVSLRKENNFCKHIPASQPGPQTWAAVPQDSYKASRYLSGIPLFLSISLFLKVFPVIF